MVGEISEDGQWIWNGSEWNPYSPWEVPDLSNAEVQEIVQITVTKKSLREEGFFPFALERPFAILVFFTLMFPGLWLESLSIDGISMLGTTIFTLSAICLFVSIPLGPLFWIAIFIWPSSDYNCGKCSLKLQPEEILKAVETKVQATSSSTKSITTSNPQISAGSIGGKRGSFVTMASSTSHVPVVLGRISATYLCPSESCCASNSWIFDTEVQSWTDDATGEVIHEITGSIALPKFS